MAVSPLDLGSVSLQVRAWARLCRDTDDLEEQMRCLKAIVALDPSQDWAQAALTRVWFRWVRRDHGTPQ